MANSGAANPPNIQNGLVGNLKVNNFDSGQKANGGSTWAGDGHWRGLGRQRSVTSSGALPITALDSTLIINAASDLAPVVPLASARSGAALHFKNKPGSVVQTLTRTAPDTIDGLTTYALQPGAALTIQPYTDGVNLGWFVS